MISDRVGAGAVTLLVELEPRPLEEFVLLDHPSGTGRIVMTMRWKAEDLP